MTLARLERTGWVREAGGWFEAVVACADLADGERRRAARRVRASWRCAANTLDRSVRRAPRPADADRRASTRRDARRPGRSTRSRSR